MRVLALALVAFAQVLIFVHFTGGFESAGSKLTGSRLVTDQNYRTTTTAPAEGYEDDQRDNSRTVTTPEGIHESARPDNDGGNPAETMRLEKTKSISLPPPPNALPHSPPPLPSPPAPPDEPLESAIESNESSQIGVESEEMRSYDQTHAASTLANKFSKRCSEVDAFFKRAGERYDSLQNSKVIIMDWSENFFNGIGDEMQHYQELLAIGLGTGRAAYLHTQKGVCLGTGLAGASDPPSLKHLAQNCRFDLGDYFEGMHGVDWVWNDAKETKVRQQLGDSALDDDLLVITWSPEGMFYGFGNTSFEQGDTKPKNSTYISAPNATFIKVMLSDPRYQNADVVRVRVKQTFGHWCHPHQPQDWGMCASYRYVVGIANPKSDGLDDEDLPSPPPCPDCSVGACFGASIIHPRPELKRKVAPYLVEMENRGWQHVVAAHVRTGFADISELTPPMDLARAQNATLFTIDQFLSAEAKRAAYPKPVCPSVQLAHDQVVQRVRNLGASQEDAAAKAKEQSELISSNVSTSKPFTGFLQCVAATGTVLGNGDTWGVFLMTDSPAIRTVVEHNSNKLGIKSVLATNGSYGHVKASNTAVCVDDGDKGDGGILGNSPGTNTGTTNSKSTQSHSSPCDASDPRGAWQRSMMDLLLMGFADVEVMLFQSKFGAAANFIADIDKGLREYYPDTRLTHSLLIPLLGEMRGEGYGKASEERKRVWGAVWDLFGPSGRREGLRTSEFALE